MRNTDRDQHRDQDRDRDRDRDGRAHNARPRDELGRPLPRGSPGVALPADDLALSPSDTLDEAQRLLDLGRPFHAHEVLEARWKIAGEHDRELWRGLAQLAVGITHVRRGNAPGAASLLRRAADRIGASVADQPIDSRRVDPPPSGDHPDGVRAGPSASPYGIHVGTLAAWCRALAARVVESGADEIPPEDLVVCFRPTSTARPRTAQPRTAQPPTAQQGTYATPSPGTS